MPARTYRCVALLFAAAAGLAAQVSTSRLEGIVLDASGTPLPGATLSVLNTTTGARTDTKTDGYGSFVFPSLPAGIYDLTAVCTGFKSAVRRGVVLAVSETVSESFRLEAGSAAEEVLLETRTERVNLADPQIGHAVTLRDINVLPDVDRNPMNLAAIQPGIQVAAANSRVNGARQGSNDTRLDGVDVNDASAPSLPLSVVGLNTDSVGEFRIVTSGGKAQYGRNAGAQIEMVTRSGASLWHGNAFDYLRNTVLNANNFFANKTGLAKPKLIQNTFGGSAGGPVLRGRTFLFANYQGRRTRTQNVVNRWVLTPEARAGLFRWREPRTGVLRSFDILANDPRKKGIDPRVADAIKLLPLPNNFDLGDGLNTAGFRFNTPTNSLSDQATVRADHNLSARHRLFYRHSWSHGEAIDRPAIYPGRLPGTQETPAWGNALGWDWVIKPEMVNEFRFGRSDYSVDLNRPARLPGAMLMNNCWTDPLEWVSFPSTRKSPVTHWTDNLTRLRAGHTLKAGGDLRLTSWRETINTDVWPLVTFLPEKNNIPSGIGPTIESGQISGPDRDWFEELYNDLLGRIDGVGQVFYSDLRKFYPAGTGRVRDWRIIDYSLFAQDDWRLKRNFVVSLGLRWEYFGRPRDRNGNQGVLDKRISPASQFADLRIVRRGEWYDPDRNNFAPRFGFAWDPKGDGRMSVRGNYGIFYDRTVGGAMAYYDQFFPGFSQYSVVYPQLLPGSDGRLSDGIPAPPQPTVQSLLPATRSTDATAFDRRLRTGYVQEYSLDVQRELFPNTVVEAGYIGARGVKLFMWQNLNRGVKPDFLEAFRQVQAWVIDNNTAVPAANALVRIFGSPASAVAALGGRSTFLQSNAGRAGDALDISNYSRYAPAGVSPFYIRNFPQFIFFVYGGNGGRSYYDSLQVSLRRQAGALKFAGAYTFSKTIDLTAVDGRASTGLMDTFNPRLDRAISNMDRRHSLNYAIAYTLPFHRGQGLGSRLLAGWDLGLLGLWQSGTPFSVSSGRTTMGIGIASYGNYSGSRGIGEVTRAGDGVYYWGPEVNRQVSFPGVGDPGNAGRNVFRGPRTFSMDMSLVKRFRTTEGQALVLRGEAYSLLNNPTFGLPGSTLANPATFGKINSASGARVFQLALRYEF